MDDDGQMILLSALLACLCLMGVIACVAAMDDTAYKEKPVLSPDFMSNVMWAQENALGQAAHHSTHNWDSRANAASDFKAEANASIDSTALALLKHGMAYRFSYNDSLAFEYAALHPDNETVSIGGIIVEKKGGLAMVKGCACDVSVGDGSRSYRVTRIIFFD